jgi:hypothetical protein
MPKGFLASLYADTRDDEYLELRLLPSARQTFIPVGVLRQNGWVLPQQPNGLNVYFSVIPRVRDGGKANDCSDAVAVWADYDNPNEKPHFKLAPSLVVCTSVGKYQCYWMLKERCGDLGLIESINHSIAMQAGADTNAIDRARILRVPEYPNRKYDPPQLVELWVNEPSRRYSVEELRTAWPEVKPLRDYERRTYDDSVETPEWVGDIYEAIVSYLDASNYRGHPEGGGMKFDCPLCTTPEPRPPLSIHPVRGWKCFGCEDNGSLAELAHKLGVRVS